MLANYFFLVGASFLLGIVLASITSYWFLFVLSALVFIKIPRLAILTFIFFLLGGAYLIWRTPIISNADSARLLQRREIVVSIVSQGRNRGFYKEFTGIASIDKTPIKILLAIPQFYQIKVGDQLALTGQFELLKEPYHLDRKLQAKFYVKQLTVLKTQTSFTAILARWKQTLTGKLNEKLSLSASQLISGLLYGQDITEPRLRQNLKQAGLSHLTAISGYNLTLIGSLLFEGLKFFPLSAATISLISTVAIIVFALFVGGQASIIRAALMGVLLIGCKSLGRVPLRRNILLVAALLITLAEPQALVVDLGFQLSFLATIGILYLAEPIKQLISHKPEQPNRLKQTLAETIAAQSMTLPLIWYKFGAVNLFSFFTNALVLPFVPYLMILSIFILIFLALPYLAFFSWPYEWFANLIQLLAKIPMLRLTIPLAFVLVLYAYLFFWIYRANKNAQPDLSFNFG